MCGVTPTFQRLVFLLTGLSLPTFKDSNPDDLNGLSLDLKVYSHPRLVLLRISYSGKILITEIKV